MKYILTLSLLLISSMASFAQDRMFAYTYQTNVLNKGAFDLEFHNELRTGKVGAYSPYLFGQHLNQRIELEFGLGKNVQTAFYFNSERFDFAETGSSEISSELEINFSNEWKWKLSDPVANGLGFTLYEEVEFGGNNVEFETKAIFDKQWLHDLVAFNIVYIYEIEKEIEIEDNVAKAEWESSSPVEFYLAYMHFPKPEIGFGLEVVNYNDITEKDGWMNSVLFAGPAFHASVEKFFANISALPQIANLHKTEFAPGSRDLNGFEAFQVKLLAGYSF